MDGLTDQQTNRRMDKAGRKAACMQPQKVLDYKSVFLHYCEGHHLFCSTTRHVAEQGRIHGYPSRMRLGRGRILGHLITWAGAMRQKKS